MIKNVMGAFFSPTGSTAKIVEAVAKGVAQSLEVEAKPFDWTTPKNREWKIEFESTDLLVIGVPTYAGRVPNKVMPFVRDNLVGDNTLAIPVVTYGHRAYDDSLAELTTLLADNGFLPMGAVAVPTEHSFVPNLGTGKPTQEDLTAAFVYGVSAGVRAKELLQSVKMSKKAMAKKRAKVPYDFAKLAEEVKAWREETVLAGHDIDAYYQPLGASGAPADFLKATPNLDVGKCTGCGLCELVCPVGSIAMTGTVPAGVTSPAAAAGKPIPEIGKLCIKCQACIKGCPAGALAIDNPGYLSHIQMLSETFAGNECSPEYYLADAK